MRLRCLSVGTIAERSEALLNGGLSRLSGLFESLDKPKGVIKFKELTGGEYNE